MDCKGFQGPKMSSLSAKARAFSVENLLGTCHKELETVRKKLHAEGTMCSSLGDGPPCCHSAIQTVHDGSETQKITVELCQADLWEAFHNLGTEMIITKTGRRMFPAIRVRVTGLKKFHRYRVFVDFAPVDKNKYRYVYHSSKWMISGNGEAIAPDQSYQHPDSPMEGSYLTSQVISFERIKLTNSDRPRPGQISLFSMQKFQPRVHVEEMGENGSDVVAKFVTSFPQTAFIAVTAYQNQEITRLKIARNPFAKGFREAGKCRSSLEAMMATFGVVIEGNEPTSPRKRHMVSPKGQDEDYKQVPLQKRPRCSSLDAARYERIPTPTKYVSPFRDVTVETTTKQERSSLLPVIPACDSLLKIHPAFRWPSVHTSGLLSADRKLTHAYNSEGLFPTVPLPGMMYLHPVPGYGQLHCQPFLSVPKDDSNSEALALDKYSTSSTSR